MKRKLLSALILVTFASWKILCGAQDTPVRSAAAPLPANALDTTDYWRRTAHGWQWLPPVEQPVEFLQLHPLTVAAFFLLASLLAMLMMNKSRPISPRHIS